MSVYFSQSTQAFYAKDIDYPNLPTDIIEIDDRQHAEVWAKLNTGFKAVLQDGVFTYAPKANIVTWNDIRARREGELARTDYTQMADWPGDKEVWALYRQELRDIPQNFSDPNEVVWPTPPE